MANISRLLTGILKGADKTAKKILVDALEDPANLTGKGEIRKDTLTALAEKEGLSRNLKDLISAAKDNTGARQLIGDFKTGRRKIGEDEPGGFKVYQDAAREVKTGETPEAFTARRKKEGKEKGKKVFEFLKNMPEDLRPKEKGEKYSVIRDLARIQTKARKQEKIQKDLDNILKKAYKEGTFANIVKDNPDIAKKIKDPKFKSAIEKGYKELIEDAGLFIEKGADKSRFKSLINPVRLNALVKAAKETNYIPKGKNKTDPFFSNKNIKNRLGFNKPIDEFTIGPKRGISPLRFPDLPEGSDPNQLALQEARKSLATTRALDLAVDPRMPGPKEAVSAKQMAEIMRGGDPAFRTLEVTRTGPRGTIEPDAELLDEK